MPQEAVAVAGEAETTGQEGGEVEVDGRRLLDEEVGIKDGDDEEGGERRHVRTITRNMPSWRITISVLIIAIGKHTMHMQDTRHHFLRECDPFPRPAEGGGQ